MSSNEASEGGNDTITRASGQLLDVGRKSTRRGLPKLRTGCGTCKIRHVKCDEEKPTCRRCRNFGVICNGYPYLPKTQLPQSSKARALVPKQYSEIPSPGSTAGVYSGPRFTDQREACYFQYYCTEIAGKIASNCRSTIWDQIIPQAGGNEGFIAHGIAALGALSLSRTMSQNSLSSNRAFPGAIKSNPHFQYALAQYCKSLKSMREGLQRQIWGRTRTTLIASLVIFCIESLLNNADSASIHASKSISLLYQWRHQHAISDKHLCAQDAFEEDLYPAFPGLDLQALLHLDDRPQVVHSEFQKYLDQGLEGHPKTLTTLNEGIVACQLLLRRSLHFIAAWRVLDGYPDITKLDDSAINGKVLWSVALGPLSIPLSKRVEQRSYLADINRYKTALNDLLEASNQSEYSMVFYAGAICKIHTAMNTILLTGSCLPARTSCHSLLSEFHEIVTLCEQIYLQASSKGGSTYVFDMGLIVPLSVVAIRCRDVRLRKNAIKLLLSKPGYREGIWDAEAMGHVCKWVVTIEEEASLDELSYVAGKIDDQGRLGKDEAAAEDKIPTLLMVHFKLNDRKARAFCAVPVRGKDEELVLKETVISW